MNDIKIKNTIDILSKEIFAVLLPIDYFLAKLRNSETFKNISNISDISIFKNLISELENIDTNLKKVEPIIQNNLPH